MTYLFYFIISFIIVVFQTVILVNSPFIRHVYDIILVLIIYVGLFRPVSEGVAVVFIVGVFMDGLSGSPFWAHTTTYFWLLIIVKWLIQFLNAGSMILLPFTVLIGILLENSIFLMVSKGIALPSGLLVSDIHKIFSQIIWGTITGPPAIILVKKMHERTGIPVLPGDRSEKKK
ncbi:MAG: hypothetical protein KJ737_24675 [Proteobacteria bacterium]|nr:hypothetical protein [Pseudomonadota bacterium]